MGIFFLQCWSCASINIFAQSTNDLRVKCIRLIGRQNLQLYRDWKGNAEDIAREYEANKAIGLKYGTWKQGVLIYDDDGKVEKELIEYHKNKQK